MLYLFTLSNVCFAQTEGKNWTNEILVYIIFDLLFLVAVVVLVKLIGMSAKLSKYY
jgi:multisubunit Na+/H+ antiporter MnhB subunit